ncbi:hypothetical protein B0F90DRAFT_1809233 [Multifurca ochricompacta]|uniref:Mini-chromosome maintenance complex-binding protein n=1 Tax=Multifurca ochricompacta TaxID=376703 RepID=A0AAD4M719_9AGAM|nr:hypothetical protein B0F90DRAFT_1809233 [Multifurca ochricompacta]
MVSSLLVEALSSPTDVLLSLYDVYDHEALNDFPKAVAMHFSNIFRTEEAFLEIPPLVPARSQSSYHDRTLVRFRALVQDTSPSPEVYSSKLKEGKCGGWGLVDVFQGDGDNNHFDYNNLRDCIVLWAVSVPALLDGEDLNAQGKSPSEGFHLARFKDQQWITMLSHFALISIPFREMHIAEYKSRSACPNLLYRDAMIVPTLHVLFVREHRLDILKAPSDPVWAHVREELLGWIADEALGGDLDAAEWVLLTCVARVQSRIRSLNPPSLTLAHFPSSTSSPPALSHVLSLLLPLFMKLPLSLDLLNSDLRSGYLQLAQGTTVLMTESGIQEGKLIERGVLNVRAIQQVINTQTLAYKFPFSEFSFPTDITFVILAQGTKSALFQVCKQTDVTLPLNSPSINDLYKPKSDIKLPSLDKLEAYRRLILSAKTGNIEMTDAVSEHIQEDFVRQRKEDSTMSPEDLKQTITIARLVGLTMHDSTVTLKGWEHAKELNKRRKARFA